MKGGILMFCHKCGHKLPEDARFCTRCGAPVREAEQPETAAVNRDYNPAPVVSEAPAATAAAEKPAVIPAESVTVITEEPAPRMQSAPGKKKGMGASVTALVFGIFSILLFPIGLVLGLVAVICGGVGLKRCGSGMAAAGLVTGIIGMVVGLVVAAGFFAGLGVMRRYNVWDEVAPYTDYRNWEPVSIYGDFYM